MILAVDVSPVTRSGAQDAARRELSKAIYHRYDDPWPVRAFRAIVHWIGDALDALARHAPGGGAGAFGLVAAVVILLALARWRLGPVRREHRTTGPLFADTTTTAAEHLRAAEAAAAAGRWEDAVVARMRAVVRSLEERGVIDDRPGRTADELRDEAAAVLPRAAEALSIATTVFDDVAYGGRPADAGSYASIVRADEAIREPSTAGGRR